MNLDLTLDLTQQQFRAISELVYRVSRISLSEGKEGLVRTRLAKRIRQLGLAGFQPYLEMISADRTGAEAAILVDLLTTNKTSFFRENQHFDLLANELLPEMVRRGRPLRFWSAGCSSGEEPYTLGMILHDRLPEGSRSMARVLATDISARMLAQARAATYSADRVQEIPSELRRRYLHPAAGETRAFEVDAAVRSLVSFARLNLMDPWPMKGPFDVIFCRNVMIYFDRATQEELVARFWEKLAPGGYLFVGHSESLSALSHAFTYVQPAVYVR